MPRPRNFSPWAYWMLHLESVETRDPCPDRDPSALPAWSERFRERLDAALGSAVPPAPVPLDLEVIETTDAGAYRREYVVFDSEPAMSVPAFLLVPHARPEPGPAVLAIHGHGPGKSAVCA
ncbi:MAG: hypothetical protein E6G60_18635, partial [Actinobacteria bacterium]